MEQFTDITFVYLCVKYVALIGILISSLELLYNWKTYKDDALFSWKIISSTKTSQHKGIHDFLSFFLKYPNFLGILSVQVIAVLLTFILGNTLETLLIAIIIITTLLINYRSIYGQDGSDQMSSIILVTLFIYSIDPSNYMIANAGIWFICLQAILSYFTAGFYKAKGEKWTTKPNAVFLIFNTSTYGSKPIASVLKDNAPMTKLLTWSTVVIECTFPLVLITGYPGMIVFLGWGFAFHLMNALVMGLNSFFWAFIATYITIIYCAFQIAEYWIL
ncbi:hypothetical protein [uncultured Kordia sp.]|uniref:hypothetical protein n=1 Tax=uncultured Kordia sp. TaxID=507699 RepID=UPI00261B6BE2|nr:hypothetical protein [uncultured Kordia sp.]